MKHYVKRCLAALLAIVLAFTMFPSSVARASEAKALQEATQAAGGGSGQEAPQAVDEMGLLASFDFNTEALDGKFVSKDVMAAIVGTGAALQDRDEAHGKALYLDGASYLDLKKSDGSSLLTGQKEITISFEAKPARTGTNWGFFAAPNANKQEYQKEHYIGALISGGSTTIERYNNNGSRPASVSAATGTDWSHVDVVLAEAETVLYVDGTKAAAQASSYSLADILGNNSIFQLGKANWGDGEYCQGWIDNFQIYSKALSEEEIQTIPSEAYRQAVLEKQAAKIASVTLEEERVNLPDYNGTVTWKSSLDAVVIAENGRTAAVKQPAVGTAPVMGKLTAVVSVYGLTKEVEVDAVIKPQVGENEPYGYLMVHFVEDSNGYAEKIYLDISRGDNPEQWDPLNGREPILASNLGTSGSRDPFITYSPETETYYILGTDLRVFGGDNAQWEAWQQNYSTKMNIWESKDLISWSEVRQFDVARNQDGQKMANLGMMWAPEATWVPDYYGEGNGAFVVYWSSQCYVDEAQTQKDSGSKIMWGATKDFTQATWEYGGVFLDGGAKGWIDTTIAQNGNKTYHITKSHEEQIIMEVTTDKEWWKQGTNWTRVQSNIGQSRFGSVEGPAVFKDHSNENRWYLFVDDLPQPGYQPMISTDLDKGWDYLDSPDYFLTINTKHGGVISLTKKQYDSLRRADAVSLADSQPESVKVPFGATEGAVAAALPATAKVNMAYNMGTSDLPVDWDISPVKTDREGTYAVTGTVRSIGANKNQWVGKNGSTSYLAEDKQLYSSKELKVSVDVQVDAKPQEILPTGVTLERSSVSLTVGKKLTLKAQVAPGNAADKTLAWKSSKASVATVSQNGTVTAKAAGTANITVSTVNGKTAVCKVTVKPKKIAVKSITLSQKKATLGVKEKLALKATVKPSNATDHKVTWTTSKSSVATVTSKGVVTAKKKGTAKITATVDGKKAACTIIVKAAPKKISLNAKKATVKRGKTYQIKVKLPKNTASYKVTYSTSNKKVATVSSAGKVKGLKKGTATITVKTFNKKRATIKVTVK